MEWSATIRISQGKISFMADWELNVFGAYIFSLTRQNEESCVFALRGHIQLCVYVGSSCEEQCEKATIVTS